MRCLWQSFGRAKGKILLLKMCSHSQAASYASQTPAEESYLPVCHLCEGFSVGSSIRKPIESGTKNDEGPISSRGTRRCCEFPSWLHKVLSWLFYSRMLYPLPGRVI